jgi:hypothetical protein
VIKLIKLFSEVTRLMTSAIRDGDHAARLALLLAVFALAAVALKVSV